MRDRFRKPRYTAAASRAETNDHLGPASRQGGHVGHQMRELPAARNKARNAEIAVEETTVDNVLEQPKDDSTMKQTVAALFKAIEDHAENYYSDTSSNATYSSKEALLQSNSLASGISMQNGVDFGALLADPTSRSSAVTSLITAMLLDAIDFFGPAETTLLPGIVTGFLSASTRQVKDNQRSRLNLSRWRTSTAYLLGSDESHRYRAQLQPVIDALLADVDRVTGEYIGRQTDRDRRQHFSKLCKRAQDLGLLILSQPAEWRLCWKEAANAQKATTGVTRSGRASKPFFVVQPQLQRVTDNVARRLDRPLVVLEWQILD